LSVELENLRKDIRMRVETDSMMSSAWILAYLLPFLAAIVLILSFVSILITTIPSSLSKGPPATISTTAQLEALIATFSLLFLLVSLLSLIVYVVLFYKLIKRRNTHFKRQIFLFEDIAAAVKAIAEKKGVNIEVELSSCQRTVREIRAEETEKGAVLWAILSLISWTFLVPLADLYVRYFLMKDFYKHERREDGFWEDISRTLDKCGVTFSVPRRTEVMPERSFVLYLILTIITVGLFGIYWIYVLLKDPNQHFSYHTQIEDQLLSSLQSVTI